MKLFVYGSLLRGMSLSSHMEGASYLGPAYVMADLFFLGFYPGIIPGNNVVFGELYEVPLKILPEIDKVEDCYENNPESSIYLRKSIEVHCFADGKVVKAYAYYYNREPEGKPRISYGDYRRFMHLQKSDKAWYIGYGSNMSSKTIFSKIGEVPEHKVVQIEGFENLFNLRTGRNGFARANLKYTGEKTKLDLVAWKLNSEQFEKLDIEEQVPNLYYRVSMPYVDTKGEFVHAQTYMANTKMLGTNLHPEPHYMDLQRKGMREHGLG
jgi:gamma-glutamylcyclotransferase (GGCT)/AIG2-like uncharacterized protein YtfP